MEIQIEKGIPVPGLKDSPAKNFLQTLRDMEVGDSFLYPKEKRNGFFAYACRIPGAKFKTRSVSDSDVRVWRVA